MLEKLQKLAKLNEDLKEFNPDYAYTKHLAENNIRRVAKWGQEINQEKEFNIIRTEYELEKRRKARLLNSRWLSDGTLECEFIDKDGECFTKIYQEDDIFARRQEEREEKMAAENHNAEEEFRRFGYLFPTGVKMEKKEKLEAIYG